MQYRPSIFCMFSFLFLVSFCMSLESYAASAQSMNLKAVVNPVSRYTRLMYNVPADAPDTIIVECVYSTDNGKNWTPAAIKKYRSETAEYILSATEPNLIDKELLTGRVKEFMAAGLERSLIWQTYPQLLNREKNILVQIRIFDSSTILLSEEKIQVNRGIIEKGVVVLNDFEKVCQYYNIITNKSDTPGWHIVKQGDSTILQASEAKGLLEPLTYRIKLTGYYAVFVSVPNDPVSAIELRVTDDLYNQVFYNNKKEREFFWRFIKMDNQSLIISQPHSTIEAGLNDSYRSRLNYVRFVPISEQLYNQNTWLTKLKKDKLVFTYFEPYSWAFHEYVISSFKFGEAFAAYRDARSDFIDMQLDRLGARPIYPSAVEEPLLGSTYGDPAPGGKAPHSIGVARLPLFTHPMQGALIFSQGMNIPVSANFGAGICYPDSPLQGEFSKAHPEWIKDKVWLQYKYKPVRKHFLALYEEQLKVGAKYLSLDFGRYPYVVDAEELPTLFLQELRDLADKYSKPDDKVRILVRFPVPGVSGENGYFKPQEWVERKLIDFLVPSGVHANMNNFDCRSYIKMTRGTGIKCLPDLEGGVSLIWPGGILKRVKQYYDWGADGIYIYQADARIVGTMCSRNGGQFRRVISKLGSTAGVNAMIDDIQKKNSEYSNDIYFYFPSPYQSCRIRIWTEGFSADTVRILKDGELLNKYTNSLPPYIVGQDGYTNNYSFIGTPVTIEVQARMGQRLFEKKYHIKNIFRSTH